MSEHMMPIPSRLYNAAVGGHVAGADQIIDDETGLTLDKVTGGALEEKTYTSGSDNGMGRVVLRKNLVNGVNTLVQTMINKSNTIYVIQYDFTLGEDITIPANCVLEFYGGSISAGSGENKDTITGNNTGIHAGLVKIFNTNVTFAGIWNIIEAYPEWFGAKGDGVTDDTQAIQKTINSFKTINAPGIYKTTSEIIINRQYTTFKFNVITPNDCDGISLAGYNLNIVGKELICNDDYSGIKFGYASAEISMAGVYKYAGAMDIDIHHIVGGYGIDMYLQEDGHINEVRFHNTWCNGKIYAIKISGDIDNYTKNDLSRFNNNSFDNCNIEASMKGVYAENVTWYSVLFNNFRTNEMYLPGRGAVFTFKNCLIANSRIYESRYSSYRGWVIENTPTFEVVVGGIANANGNLLSNEAFIKYDSYAQKLVPIFKRNDNLAKTPKLSASTIIDTNGNYFGLKDFILENSANININFDAPYNYLGFNKIRILVPNICDSANIRYKTSNGAYNPSGVNIPETFEPTIYNVFFTGNQIGYLEKNTFNGDPDIIDTTLLSLPRTENTKYFINSGHTDVLFKKVYAKIILDKVVFGNPNSQFLEICQADDTILRAISPSNYGIGTEEKTRTLLVELPNTNAIAYIRLVVYGYSSPSAGKIQVRVRGIV